MANIDSWTQGLSAQIENEDMLSKMENALACIGGTPDVSAVAKIRALAKETGLAELGYPIHLCRDKVMKIVPDAMFGTSLEDDANEVPVIRKKK